jgi:putative transposase
MKSLRLIYTIPFLCRVLEISRSGYYAWVRRPASKRTQREGRLEAQIRAAHERTRKTCGPDRLQKDLAAHGVKIGIYTIRRIRKKLGIWCKQVKRFKRTTDSAHKLPVAPNLLDQQFEVSAPHQAWVTDITYIPTDEGWLYCAAHKDLFNGEIVGYALGSRMTTDLVKQSLLKALATKRPPEGLIHHSDRGIQYCAHEYQRLLNRWSIRPSMSRKGNCYDNAPMESFWGTMKNELIHHRRYATRVEAIREITEYIEVFYNRERRQKRLGYLSPAVYVKRFYAERAAA